MRRSQYGDYSYDIEPLLAYFRDQHKAFSGQPVALGIENVIANLELIDQSQKAGGVETPVLWLQAKEAFQVQGILAESITPAAMQKLNNLIDPVVQNGRWPAIERMQGIMGPGALDVAGPDVFDVAEPARPIPQTLSPQVLAT